MKLYHGSDILVSHPDLNKGKPFKDFGKGFYLSDDYQQAMERAEQIASLTLGGTPVVSTYEFDVSSMARLQMIMSFVKCVDSSWVIFLWKS